METETAGTDDALRRLARRMMKLPLLTQDEEARLVRRWQDDGDGAALDDLVLAHMKLVLRWASRYSTYGVAVDDLIQEGCLGLLEAADKFDTERGFRFSTYAMWSVKSAIKKFIVANASVVHRGRSNSERRIYFKLRHIQARIPRGDERDADDLAARWLDVEPEDIQRARSLLNGPDVTLNWPIGGSGPEPLDLLADPGPDPESMVAKSRATGTRSRLLADAMAGLNDREKRIMGERWLDGDGLTLAELGEGFGIFKERVRQIERRAFEKLHQLLD